VKQRHLSILLEKYEDGSISDTELAELNEWYHSFTKRETALEEDLTKNPGLLKTLRFQLWNGIEEQISFELEPQDIAEDRPVRRIPSWIYRVAATLVVGTLIGLAFWKLRPVSPTNDFHTVSTQKNNLSKIKLSDGTTIWIKSGSNLRYPEQFEAGSREVYLEGEAFFDVTHDDEKPFLVHTSDLTIRVLGTAFNVKSYQDQGTIETTLVRGKVKIEKDNMPDEKEVILTPNERAVYHKNSRMLDIVKSVDIAEVVVKETQPAATETALVFDETPFNQVFAELEERYHVKIHLDNQDNLSCKLTADLQKEELEEILQLLEVSHQIRFRISGNDVYIQGKLCH
jgi:transmembrane sensor